MPAEPTATVACACARRTSSTSAARSPARSRAAPTRSTTARASCSRTPRRPRARTSATRSSPPARRSPAGRGRPPTTAARSSTASPRCSTGRRDAVRRRGRRRRGRLGARRARAASTRRSTAASGTRAGPTSSRRSRARPTRSPGRTSTSRSPSRPASSAIWPRRSRACSASSACSRRCSAPATRRSSSPSESRPLPAVSLTEVLATSDLPGGVVNLLTGFTAELGAVARQPPRRQRDRPHRRRARRPCRAAARGRRQRQAGLRARGDADWADRPRHRAADRLRRDEDGLAPDRGVRAPPAGADRAGIPLTRPYLAGAASARRRPRSRARARRCPRTAPPPAGAPAHVGDLGVVEVERDQVGRRAGRDLRRLEPERAGAVHREALQQRAAPGRPRPRRTSTFRRPRLAPRERPRSRAPPRRDRGACSSRRRRRPGRRAPTAAPQAGSRRRGSPRCSGRRRRSRRARPAGRARRRRRGWRGRSSCAGRAAPQRVEQLDRAQAVLGERLVDLARLLVGVDVHRQAGLGGSARRSPRATSRGQRADRVRRGADRDQRIARDGLAQRVDAREVGLDRGVAEAALARARRQVARRRARRRSAAARGGCRRPGGVADRVGERVRLVVRRAVGLVVDVVELADRRVAGARASRKQAARRRRTRAGVERAGGGVHRLAPRPEVVVGRSGSTRSTRPRRSRWKACEWALTKPGASSRPRQARARRPARARALEQAATMPPPRRPRPRRRRARRVGVEHELGRRAPSRRSIRGRSRPRSRARARAPLVARVGVAHDAGAGIVRQHALDAARALVGAVRDDLRAGVDRAADADAAAVVQRDPGGAGGRRSASRSGAASRRSRRSRRACPRSRGRARRPSPSRGGRGRSRSAPSPRRERTSSLKRRPARWRSP